MLTRQQTRRWRRLRVFLFRAKVVELTPSIIIALLALVVTGPLSWIVRSLIADVKALSDELAKHETHVAERYVEKNDLHRELGEIKTMIKRLFDKLDSR